MEFCDAVDRLKGTLQLIFHNKAKCSSQKRSRNQPIQIPWSWVAVRFARLLLQYSAGVTESLVLGELEVEWERTYDADIAENEEFGTVSSVYHTKHSIPVEATVDDWEMIPGSNVYRITAKDEKTSKKLDMLLHPKFNSWVSSAQLNMKQPLLKNRKIRFFCRPRINTPINNEYGNEALPRSLRIALVPPTPVLLFVLNREDKAFIQTVFCDCLRFLSAPMRMNNTHKRRVYKLWLKIIHVEQGVHITANQVSNQDVISGDAEAYPRIRRTDIFVVDMTCDNEPAILSLYDEQTHFASMFQRGDYIGLYNPGFPPYTTESQDSRSDIIFEYTNDTTLFYMSGKEAHEARCAKSDARSVPLDRSGSEASDVLSLSQWEKPVRASIAERDEEGFLDCASYPDRIFIDDIEPRMLNLTIFCRVLALASNNPFDRDGTGKRMDRYAMRVCDNTGKTDITFWENIGNNARTLRPGQYVLMTGLCTSSLHKSAKGPIWYVNGSDVSNTEIFNVSTLKALLVSNDFRQITSYCDIEDRDQWQDAVYVVGWEIRSRTKVHPLLSSKDDKGMDKIKDLGKLLVLEAHKVCLQAVRRCKERENAIPDHWTCDFCKALISEDEVVQTFRSRQGSLLSFPENQTEPQDDECWIEWILHDDTCAFFRAFGCEETLLNISAQQFKFMSYETQVGFLDSVVGKQFLCAISSKGHKSYRIDQAAPLQVSVNQCLAIISPEKEQILAHFSV